MRHARIIYVIGDVHGSFSVLNTFINRKIRQDRTLRAIAARWKGEGNDLQVIILQCGDFAWFWPDDSKPVVQNKINWLPVPGGRVPLYWVGGNHEDWDELDTLGTNIYAVSNGNYFCPFGSTLQLSPGVTVLFAGGAESADKKERMEFMLKHRVKVWWEQEGISEADLERLDSVPKADWVVSHTAPYVFDVDAKMRAIWGHSSHLLERSREKLDKVFDKYHPRRWFFGHFHHSMKGLTEGCEWIGLSNIDGGSGECFKRCYLEWEDED